MRKNNFTKIQKLTMLALVLALLFNPMVVEILQDYFKWAYTGISVLCTIWVLGFLLYKVFKPEQVTIPKKNKKSVVKSKEYLADD